MAWGKWFLLGTFGLVFLAFMVYEVLALANRHPGDTISEYVWVAIQKYPIINSLICFFTGLLFGHFFWQRAP